VPGYGLLRYRVMLPPSYGEQTSSRYPVIYAQDAQSLWSDGQDPFGLWNLDRVLDALWDVRSLEELIVVSIDTKDRRLERLGPTTLIVEAGVSTGKVLHAATGWELGGVEFLGGVPGSVGGGLIMNAGTYLGEFKDVTVEVASLRVADGALRRRDAAACGFRYRHSDLPADEIVVEGTLHLRPRPRAEIEAEVRTLRDRRHEREPKGQPNAGSIFKNPPGQFAGKLIEECGLKGRRAGGAEVSPKHANWIVNAGGARAADVLALIEQVRTAVRERHGIELEMEVKVLGDDE
jgi:UDP-N-acetylmuramate dehydrogenase